VTSISYCSEPAILQYDLGRHYQKLTMVAGLSDSSSSAAALQIDVTLDGRTVFSQVATLGAPVTVDVDVSGGLRLELRATRVEPDCNRSSSSSGSGVVWGDPEIFGVPGEVPTATATPTN
jgi:hypothetical protein